MTYYYLPLTSHQPPTTPNPPQLYNIGCLFPDSTLHHHALLALITSHALPPSRQVSSREVITSSTPSTQSPSIYCCHFALFQAYTSSPPFMLLSRP